MSVESIREASDKLVVERDGRFDSLPCERIRLDYPEQQGRGEAYMGCTQGGVIYAAIAANIGNFISPMLLVTFASIFYIKYKNIPALKGAFHMIQLVMFSMIISVAFQLININQLIQPRSLFVIIITSILFIYTKVNPALIIVCAAILGAFLK